MEEETTSTARPSHGLLLIRLRIELPFAARASAFYAPPAARSPAWRPTLLVGRPHSAAAPARRPSPPSPSAVLAHLEEAALGGVPLPPDLHELLARAVPPDHRSPAGLRRLRFATQQVLDVVATALRRASCTGRRRPPMGSCTSGLRATRPAASRVPRTGLMRRPPEASCPSPCLSRSRRRCSTLPRGSAALLLLIIAFSSHLWAAAAERPAPLSSSPFDAARTVARSPSWASSPPLAPLR